MNVSTDITTMENDTQSLPEISSDAFNVDALTLPDGISIPNPSHSFGSRRHEDPRLIIAAIVNTNFKSYAGRQVLGPFHHSFSCIVGPNGSGKSNVIDSILFVFGFRAQKIRSKKVSVLIHTSEEHKDATSCTVEVHFAKVIDDGDGAVTPVPDSSFRVARSAYQDNTSKYFINEKIVSFKEVAQLLEQSGIDIVHNRFLILQGEVENIALMKATSKERGGEGLLEYLEDIIGTNRYKDATERLESKVEETDEQRKLILSTVKTIQKEKEAWMPRFTIAITYLIKSNQISRTKDTLFQVELEQSRTNRRKCKSKIREDTERIQNVEKKLTNIAEFRKVSEKKAHDCTRLSDENNRKFQKVNAGYRTLNGHTVKYFQEVKYKRENITKLENQVKNDEENLAHLITEKETLENTIKDLVNEKRELNEERKKAEEALFHNMVSFKQESKAWHEQKETLVQELLSKTDQVNATKEQVDLGKVEHEILMSRYTKAAAAVNATEEQIDKRSTLLQKGENRCTEIEALTNELTHSINIAAKRFTELTSKKERLQEKNNALHSTLTEMRYARQNRQARGSVHDFLQKKKQSGEIPGIHGRLGDLGAIDRKYDVAISSCCSALEHYVVDTVDTAKTCVQALKEQNVGRTTFIIMEKMVEYEKQANEVPNVPLWRLVDLVGLRDERYRTAFFYALGNTLVADDLRSATRVAYGESRRWRVVTLKGELIDTAGTMSGGGNKVMRGRMGSNCPSDDLLDESQAKRLEEQYKELEGELYTIQKTLDTLEDSLTSDGRQRDKLRAETNRVTANVDDHREVIVLLKEKLPALNAALQLAKVNDSEEKALCRKVLNSEKVYHIALKKVNVTQKKIENIEAGIERLKMETVQPLKDCVEEIKEKIQNVSASVSQNKVALTTTTRNCVKYKNAISTAKVDIKKAEELIAKLLSDGKAVEAKGVAIVEQMAGIETERKRLKEASNVAYRELEEIKTKEDQTQEELRVMKIKADGNKRNFETEVEKVRELKKSLNQLKLSEVCGETVEPLVVLTSEQLKEADPEKLQASLMLLEQEVTQMKPDLSAIKEYRHKEAQYIKRVQELEQISQKASDYRRVLENIRQRRLHEFTEGFTIINTKLKENYRMITAGGDAELEFVHSHDPFSGGISLSVRPPKKTWKVIRNLSGGEKTLTSLCLIFALHHYRPTPLYVMDEIDAALDGRNVAVIARYIVERTKDAQFIVISLRDNMTESANRLVGIYKISNCSKVCTIDPEKRIPCEADSNMISLGQ